MSNRTTARSTGPPAHLRSPRPITGSSEQTSQLPITTQWRPPTRSEPLRPMTGAANWICTPNWKGLEPNAAHPGSVLSTPAAISFTSAQAKMDTRWSTITSLPGGSFSGSFRWRGRSLRPDGTCTGLWSQSSSACFSKGSTTGCWRNLERPNFAAGQTANSDPLAVAARERWAAGG